MTARVGPVPFEDRLRAIQSITDAALSRLEDRDLPQAFVHAGMLECAVRLSAGPGVRA